jgi:hypothetical protein
MVGPLVAQWCLSKNSLKFLVFLNNIMIGGNKFNLLSIAHINLAVFIKIQRRNLRSAHMYFHIY